MNLKLPSHYDAFRLLDEGYVVRDAVLPFVTSSDSSDDSCDEYPRKRRSGLERFRERARRIEAGYKDMVREIYAGTFRILEDQLFFKVRLEYGAGFRVWGNWGRMIEKVLTLRGEYTIQEIDADTHGILFKVLTGRSFKTNYHEKLGKDRIANLCDIRFYHYFQ